MSFRRLALEEAGPFDDRYLGTALLDDADMSARLISLGWRLWFAPDAALVHISAPRGGVRVGSALETERWRFENTGFYVRKHRGVQGLAAIPTFAAIALSRGVRHRTPTAVGRLMRAFARGWGRAGKPAPRD